MATLSVVIVAQNEERTVGAVLASVAGLADEIILVDSGSTDKTIAIAQSFKARVVHQDWLGYSAQKNFAIDMANCQWILSLDADEIVTAELAREIKGILDIGENGQREDSSLDSDTTNSGIGIDGYKIPRLLHIGTQPVPKGGFYPDAQLRLFRRGKGRFRPRLVHEAVHVDGQVAKLKHDLLHYAYADISGFSQAMEKYAQLSAQHFYENGHSHWRASLLNELINPGWTFLYRQLVRGGIFGGMLTLRLNLIYCQYVRNKIRYLRQRLQQKSPRLEQPNSPNQTAQTGASK